MSPLDDKALCIRNTDFAQSRSNPDGARDSEPPSLPNVVAGEKIKVDQLKSERRSPTPLTALPPWGRLSDEERIRVAMEALLSAKGYKVLTLNMNVHWRLSKRLHSGASVNYVRDELRKVLIEACEENRIYFLLVMEVPQDDTRVHFHGAVMVPAWRVAKGFIKKLTEKIRGSPLCRKYKEIGRNKAV